MPQDAIDTDRVYHAGLAEFSEREMAAFARMIFRGHPTCHTVEFLDANGRKTEALYRGFDQVEVNGQEYRFSEATGPSTR